LLAAYELLDDEGMHEILWKNMIPAAAERRAPARGVECCEQTVVTKSAALDWDKGEC
jgi:hypothetical protein